MAWSKVVFEKSDDSNSLGFVSWSAKETEKKTQNFSVYSIFTFILPNMNHVGEHSIDKHENVMINKSLLYTKHNTVQRAIWIFTKQQGYINQDESTVA